MIAKERHNVQKAEDRAAALADTEGGAAVAAGGLDFVQAVDGGGNPYAYNVAVPRFKNYTQGFEAANDARVKGKRHGYEISGGGGKRGDHKPAPVPSAG